MNINYRNSQRERAVECGAVEAILKVMFQYSEDNDVCIRCIDWLLLLFNDFAGHPTFFKWKFCRWDLWFH